MAPHSLHGEPGFSGFDTWSPVHLHLSPLLPFPALYSYSIALCAFTVFGTHVCSSFWDFPHAPLLPGKHSLCSCLNPIHSLGLSSSTSFLRSLLWHPQSVLGAPLLPLCHTCIYCYYMSHHNANVGLRVSPVGLACQGCHEAILASVSLL